MPITGQRREDRVGGCSCLGCSQQHIPRKPASQETFQFVSLGQNPARSCFTLPLKANGLSTKTGLGCSFFLSFFFFPWTTIWAVCLYKYPSFFEARQVLLVAPVTTWQAPNLSLNTAFVEARDSNPPSLPLETQRSSTTLPENQFAQVDSSFVIKPLTYDYVWACACCNRSPDGQTGVPSQLPVAIPGYCRIAWWRLSGLAKFFLSHPLYSPCMVISI